MMDDRNVLTEQEMLYLRSFGQDELVAMAKSASIFSIDVGDVLCIIFYTSKFTMSTFKPFMEKADAFRYTLLVLPEKLTAMNTKAIDERQKKARESRELDGESSIRDPVLQTFLMADLVANKTRHRLVPKHEIVADEQAISGILKKYNLRTRTQLPIILRSDPIAQYFGMKPGQLAKITRISPSAGEYVIYRCCV